MMRLQEDGCVGPLGDPSSGGRGLGEDSHSLQGGWQSRSPGLGVGTTELRLARCGLPRGHPDPSDPPCAQLQVAERALRTCHSWNPGL